MTFGAKEEKIKISHLFYCIIKQDNATEVTGKLLLWQSWSAGYRRKIFFTLFTELSSRYQILPTARSAALYARGQKRGWKESNLSPAPLHKYVGRLFIV